MAYTKIRSVTTATIEGCLGTLMNRNNLEWQGFTNEESKTWQNFCELLIIHTGLVEFCNKVIKNKVYKYIKVTTKTLSWIDNFQNCQNS